MKHKFIKFYIAFIILCLAAVIWTGANARSVICYTANSAGQSGSTMVPGTTSGVSLCGVIDLAEIRDLTSLTIGITPGTITFAASAKNADQNGTGSGTLESGVTIPLAWAVGNANVSTAAWEALGMAGTTLFPTTTITGNTPYLVKTDTIPQGRYLAIFQEPCQVNTGESVWQVSAPQVCFF